jgi:hypothetical protein
MWMTPKLIWGSFSPSIWLSELDIATCYLFLELTFSEENSVFPFNPDFFFPVLTISANGPTIHSVCQCNLDSSIFSTLSYSISKSCSFCLKTHVEVGHWWFRPIIPASWEIAIKRITDPGQPKQKEPISKTLNTKKG